MNRNEHCLPGRRGNLFWDDEGESIDLFSSNRAFRKVESGLEGSVGQLILLVKPEITFSYRSWDRVADSTSRIGSLGVLTGAPVSGGSLKRSDIVHGITLPTKKYVHDFYNLRKGPMEFNCIDSEDIGISDSDGLDTKISIYVGTRAIEDFVGDIYSVDYFKSVNFLECEVSDEFYSRNRDAIETERADFLEGLRRSITRSLVNENSLDKKEWENLYHSVLTWRLQKQTLALDKMISVPIGEYLKSKL